MIIAFYSFAVMSIVFALLILFTRNILYAAFALVVVFFGVAGLYVMMGAPFVGVTQILVYIGGVIVFIVFGVLLTNRYKGKNLVVTSHFRFWGYALGGLVLVGLVAMYSRIDFSNFLHQVPSVANDVQTIGAQLMAFYMIPFELAGVLLLLALIGAVAIASHRTTSHQKEAKA